MSLRRKENKKRGRRTGGPGRSLRSLNRTVRFRLTDNNSPLLYISSNGSGIVSGYQNADPSGGSGSTWTSTEWSALTSLYSEVRMIEFSIYFTPVSPEDTKNITTSGGNAVTVSGVLSSVAAAPTSRAQVWDNADAKIFCCLSMTTGKPYKHTIRPGRKLNWAVVTTPNPGSYAGCPGAIQYYGDGMVASAPLFAVSMEGIYEFRSRI
jgi:hypothetical protein